MLRLAVLAVALVILGGCYSSESFLLDGSKAVRILQPGPQVSAQEGQPPHKVEVVVRPNGWYEMRDDDGKPIWMIFIPMPDQKDRFFLAVGNDPDKPGFMYGVALRQAGKIGFDMTDCNEKPQSEIAARAGAKVEQFACTFTDGRSLTRALGDYAKIGRPMDKLPTLPALP